MESNKKLENNTKYFKLEQSKLDQNPNKTVISPPPNIVAPMDEDKIEVLSMTEISSNPPDKPNCLQRISQLFCFRDRDIQDNLLQSNIYKPTTLR